MKNTLLMETIARVKNDMVFDKNNEFDTYVANMLDSIINHDDTYKVKVSENDDVTYTIIDDSFAVNDDAEYIVDVKPEDTAVICKNGELTALFTYIILREKSYVSGVITATQKINDGNINYTMDIRNKDSDKLTLISTCTAINVLNNPPTEFTEYNIDEFIESFWELSLPFINSVYFNDGE